MRRLFFVLMALVFAIGATVPAAAAPAKKQISINVLLSTDVTDEILADLGAYGKISDVIYQIDAVVMKARESDLSAIRALPYVAAATPDAERLGAPIDTVAVEDFADGLSTWNLDAIDVTDIGFANRQVEYDGAGVYVAVLDTGLHDSWRQYFPEERIAVEYARSFGGGGSPSANVSEQPNKWEHDQNGHGTHVTSTILGYSLRGTPITGVAPMVKVIPVKVLNQNGSGWSSVISRGITYIADLKAGPLKDHPVVINMSLGGPILDAVEKAAIDYAIEQGVIVVSSAGNAGEEGMSYPAAYEPVISVAAAGWVGEWVGSPYWWYASDVADPYDPAQFYITDFSSRDTVEEHDLDVAAPGSWVVGPYQLNSGQTSYYFLGGTSMASPHVAGLVALMAQKNPALTQADAEMILESTAMPLPAGCREVMTPWGIAEEYCWEDNATGAGLINAPAALDATP